MRKFTLCILFMLIQLTCIKAQDPVIDSLKFALKNAKHDTTRILILSELSEVCDVSDILKYAESCVKLCEKGNKVNSLTFNYLKPLAGAFNNIGFLYDNQGDISKALLYYNWSLKIREKINDKNGIAGCLNNIGFIYKNQGDILKALEFYHKSLVIQEITNQKKGVAYSLNNIGLIYQDQGEISKALEYYRKSLKIQEEINDKSGIAYSLNNIGYIYKNYGDPSIRSSIKESLSIGVFKALEYFQKSLTIQEEINDKQGIATSLINIGIIYQNGGESNKSLSCFQKSLKIQEGINDKKGIASSLNNIASVMLKNGSTDESIKYAKRSLQIAKELGYPSNIIEVTRILKNIYTKQNNFKEALEMYELEIQMRDSISNTETKKASIKKQFQYQYEKKAAADSVKNGEEQKVKNALLTAQQAQLDQEKTKSYALYGGLALVLVFAGFMFNRFRVTNNQKHIIELKEIETQKQNVVILQQKHLVEEKHKEITDSINYAERIQRSFLATKEQLDENLKNYFILFQPKDVVSGDFYWAHTLKNGNFVLATADSTGHGVPGAIMSLLNTSSLVRAVELGITEPAEILNHTRQTIIDRLKKDGSIEGGKDGMDCSLISFYKDKSKLVYAAANNPIWIVRENTFIELPSDKIPVGKHDKDNVSFTQHEVDLQQGDLVYTLTDGFPDQFGGPKGKKFMYKQLKEMIISVSSLSMQEQKETLTTALNNWKGDVEQVDDVCLIGIRI